MTESIERAARILKDSERAFVFTGAGVSTESGIPDFRSPGGVWSKYRMITYQEFLADNEARKEQWALHRDMYEGFKDCRPNAAHYGIAKLYEKGAVEAVVTQNIDSLHQEAGVSDEDVIELHGNEKKVKCLDCSRLYGREDIQRQLLDGTEVPLCPECGGIMKTTTIWFGEQLPKNAIDRSFELASSCECCMVVGSSLQVYPAALIPEQAVRSGAKLIVINRDPTPLDEHAEEVIGGKAGEALKKLAELF
ncbi:MAG: Sir2 family NAD-dependent protein deacetylase [Planctomycetota bacterium]|nr:Sir2 family NAD-dependent protein deacetylase [Planctomycetota bacterium]